MDLNGKLMNRYDFLLLAFRWFVSGEAFDIARDAIRRLDDADMSNESKRALVVAAIQSYLKRGSMYILRALVEVLLSQMRGNDVG